jgi:release factor glutamine methyltransferase
MLAGHLARDAVLPGGRVLDVCTGSGALAVAAARAGAGEVTAIDVSRRAVLAARLNAVLNGVRVRALRGDLFAPVAGQRFDAIVSNPPYLPADADELPRAGLERAWEAGRDGRMLLDRIVRSAREHLRPGGSLWLVHSSVCDTERTLGDLRDEGLEPEVVERRRGPLGPLLAARAEQLEARGLLAPGDREEELVAIRATARGR